MGSAITKATDMVEERKREYRANGISYYRPWIFLITDGAPTDEWQAAANKSVSGKEDKKFALLLPSAFRGRIWLLAQIGVRRPCHCRDNSVNCLAVGISSLRSVFPLPPGTEVDNKSAKRLRRRGV